MPDTRQRPEPQPDDIIRDIRNRWHSLSEREGRALLNHLRRSLESFDEVLAEFRGDR